MGEKPHRLMHNDARANDTLDSIPLDTTRSSRVVGTFGPFELSFMHCAGVDGPDHAGGLALCEI